MANTRYVRFEVDGQPVTNQTHGIPALKLSDGSEVIPTDTNAANADGAELVYAFDDTLTPVEVVGNNPHGLTLDNLVDKPMPDEDDKGQPIS